MGLLLEIMSALVSASTPSVTVISPYRRRRYVRHSHRSRWHRPGYLRYHWHLTPNRQRYYFVNKSGCWLCPFCGCA
jgi:hypothetical protein